MNILLGLFVPLELIVKDGVSEREKVGENVKVNGVAGREGTRHVGARALVG